MKATTEVEVIPVWFIQKWTKENCDKGSALSFFIETMLKDWKIEEKQNERINVDVN